MGKPKFFRRLLALTSAKLEFKMSRGMIQWLEKLRILVWNDEADSKGTDQTSGNINWFLSVNSSREFKHEGCLSKVPLRLFTEKEFFGSIWPEIHSVNLTASRK